jgi:hypothetical protein
MESLLVNFLIFVIVVAVVAWIIQSFVPPGIFQKIAWAVLLVLSAIWVIRLLKGGSVITSFLELYAPIMLA